MSVTYYSVVNPLYSVVAFTSAAIVALLSYSIFNNNKVNMNADNHRRIFTWVFLFCLMDGVWGLFAAHVIRSDAALYIISYVFHFFSISSCTMWVAYFLSRMEVKIARTRMYLNISMVLSFIQYAMLVVNMFNGFMFYVGENGYYHYTPYRSVLFYIQIAQYAAIAVTALIYMRRVEDENSKRKVTAIFAAGLAPVFFEILQKFFAKAPFSALGFTISCLVLYIFLSKDFEYQVVELSRLREELNAALERAESANQAKTAFLFNMSHDIRTPMNAIEGFTNMAIKNIDDKEKVLDCLQKTKASGELLLSLINDILEMSRIESGKMDLTLSPHDIRTYARKIDSVLKELAEPKNINLSFELGEIRDAFVDLDEGRFNRILLNLGSNAIKYTQAGGFVMFNLRQLPSETDGTGLYEFTVSDNGAGMSEEFQQRMFEAFSRETTATTSGIQGTGLGLSVTKAFVDLMNGTISCESALGQGTKFTVTVPLAVSEHEPVSAEEAPIIQDPSEVLCGKRILLVEDNEMNREIAEDILNDLAELTVECAEDGTVAVEKLKVNGPDYYDCILMDIQMPLMNGYEASRQIREMYPGSALPIIALSANAFEEDIQKSLKAGMNDHLSKPINIPLLTAALCKYMS